MNVFVIIRQQNKQRIRKETTVSEIKVLKLITMASQGKDGLISQCRHLAHGRGEIRPHIFV